MSSVVAPEVCTDPQPGLTAQTRLPARAMKILPDLPDSRRHPQGTPPTPQYVRSVTPGTGTEAYYHHRAPDYDEVYTRPERQADMLLVRDRLTDWFAGKHVLEVAAGTGWWTSVLADTAASVTATDANQATLDVARARRAWPPSVEFAVADALQLQDVRADFDAAFAGFFWSHVPLS
jgi:SAM-dependent methyltransferase